MEDCCNCLSLKQQLEDLKQKHLLDFRTIKQKIISTDTLIRSYQEKCLEYDKQKKYILELTSKLDGAQRSVEVFKLQLNKTFELKEPLQKKCHELEREKVLQYGEIQNLQDRVRGSENLISQLQMVIKEGETEAKSMKLGASIDTERIEGYKKSQKKNEAQISRLTEKLLAEKTANKDLTKSQNKVKTLLRETEESKKLIVELRKQLKTGKNDFCPQTTSTSLEKQLETMKIEAEEYKKRIKELNEEVRKVKQQQTDKNKISIKNKIKSPTTPRRSARARQIVTPKREEVLTAPEQTKPLTRLQQKHFVEEIEKNSVQYKVKPGRNNLSRQQENLTSESESDEEPTRTLMDKINEMLDIPLCLPLSPLPPSPLDDNSVSGISVGNRDPDFIFNDDTGSIDTVNDNHDICDDINTGDPNNINHGISNDVHDVGDNTHSIDGNDNIGFVSKDKPNNFDNHPILKDVHITNKTIDDEEVKSCNDADGIGNDGENTINDNRDDNQCNNNYPEKKLQNNNKHNPSTVETNSTACVKDIGSDDCKDKISSNAANTENENGLQTINLEQSRGKKRDLCESTTPEYVGTRLMTLRSRKKRRSGNSTMDFFQKEITNDEQGESKPRTGRELRRSKSMNLSQELRTPLNEVNARVAKSLEEFTEGVLEVKPRRRRTRRISSNDGDYDESFESSDTSLVGSNVLDASKQSGDDLEENNDKTKVSDAFKETSKSTRTRSMNELWKESVVTGEKDKKEERFNGAKVHVTGNQTKKVLIEHQITSEESPKKTGSEAELSEEDMLTEMTDHQQSITTDNQTRHDILNKSPQSRSMEDLSLQNVANKDLKSSVASVDSLSTAEKKHGETDCNEVFMCLQNIVEVVANETTETYLSGKISKAKGFVETENCTDSQHHHIEMEVLDCLDVVPDSVKNSYNDSKLVEKKSESNHKVKFTGNTLNDDRVKSGECFNNTNRETSDLKRTERTKLPNVDLLSSLMDVTLIPLDRTSTGNNLGTRKAHKRKTTAEVQDNPIVSCDNTSDHNGETKTAKPKQKLEEIDPINEEATTVNTVIDKNSDDIAIISKSFRSKKVSRTTLKHKTRNSPGGISFKDIKKTSLDDKSEFLKPTDRELVVNTPKTGSRTGKGPDASFNEEGIESAKPNTPVEKTNSEEPITVDGSTASSPQDPIDSWEEQLEEMSAPLSPIPGTPKRPGRSAEIFSFESLDFPLSPIPASPPHISRPDEVENIEFADQLPRSPKDPKVSKKQKSDIVDFPSNPLNRYPTINEPKYVVFMFTKLKNKEITTAELIKAFSVRKNVKNQTPIIIGLLEVLRVTQDDIEHALMEQYAEQYERVTRNEDTEDPIVSEFEMKVIIVVYRLCNNQRLCNLLNKLVSSLEKQICGMFKSGGHDAGLLAMCRICTAVCRLMGEGSFVRVLCYDIVKQNQRHSITERMMLSIAFVWPGVLGRGSHVLTILPVTISGPPYHSFLATLQVVFMSREMPEISRQWFQGLCGWCDIPRNDNVLEWLARELVRVLRLTCEVESQEKEDRGPTINSLAFETIKSLELLSIIMGWKWTNDVLIREILWPVLKEWKTQEFGKRKETIISNTIKTNDVSDSKKGGKISEDVLNGESNTKEIQCCTKAASVNTVELSGSQSNSMSVDSQSSNIYEVDSQSVKNDELVGTSNETLHSEVTMEVELKSDVLKSTALDSKTKIDLKSDGISRKHNMDMTIINILRFLGRLICERLRKGEMINVDAVNNLMCAIVTSSDLEKVTFDVQFAAAHALVDILNADPVRIAEVLDDWCTRCSKIDDQLAAQFAKRVKEARAQMWTP